MKLLMLALLMFRGHVYSQVCRNQIYFLPEYYEVPDIPKSAMTYAEHLQVAKSELKVLNFLERYADRPVFSEKVSYRDYHVDQLSAEKFSQLKHSLDSIFPDGFQFHSGSLNRQQVQALSEYGAEFIQLFSGNLTTIHRVIADKETDLKIFGPILKWSEAHKDESEYPLEIGNLIYGEREKEALRQIVSFFNTHPHEYEAVLIFETNHNFWFYPEIFPPECITVPGEFKTDWSGQYRRGPAGFVK